MLSAQQRRKVKEAFVKTYKEKYPTWQGISVTEIVENIYFGTMVSVRSNESPDGEICVYTKDGVIIFDTTRELVRYLDIKARTVVSLRDWLTMIVVLVTLGLFVAVVFKFQKPEAIGLVVTAMAGILASRELAVFRLSRSCHVKFESLHFHVWFACLGLRVLQPLCALHLPSRACNASPSECQTIQR